MRAGNHATTGAATGLRQRLGLFEAFARCAAVTALLGARRQLHLTSGHLGWRLTFADATTSEVYRETVSGRRHHHQEPSLLVVQFVLRGIGHCRLLHALFRAESILNTPLFAGFPGFRSKLWLTDHETGTYRGVYEWDDPHLAADYATTLSALLRSVSIPGSVRFQVVAGVTPDRVLRDPAVLAAAAAVPAGSHPDAPWWRIVAVTAAGRAESGRPGR